MVIKKHSRLKITFEFFAKLIVICLKYVNYQYFSHLEQINYLY